MERKLPRAAGVRMAADVAVDVDEGVVVVLL